MPPELRRLKRLQRLEQVRAIAKQAAAQDAALAESTLHQLRGLAERTRNLANGYDVRSLAADGHALRQLSQFVTGLGTISATTERDALAAQDLADRKQHELALAERARAAADERAAAQAQVVAQQLARPELSARRTVGTDLE
jgi:ABC-type phosphate transport system auxiliary subunit